MTPDLTSSHATVQYPFIPESVALLDNYTKEANALGMRVKYYCACAQTSQRSLACYASY
jgi:hypothetical protein